MPLIDVSHGTDEQTWSSSARLRALSAFEWPRAGRIVVVAPHPDDETLGVGGAMCVAQRLGLEVELIALTEGEASHAASPAFPAARLAQLRAGERSRALTALGLSGAPLAQLNLPDGALARSVGLAARLTPLLRGARCCFAPLRCDGHPDHDAAGSAAALACAAIGVALCEYPIWAWSWSHPARDELPWTRARRIPLPDFARHAKRDAMRAYGSQTEARYGTPAAAPILPASVLAHFARDFEVLFV